MKNKTQYCIGVMSGTSLDGVDLAYIKFDSSVTIKYEIISAITISYSSLWKEKLTNAFTSSAVEITQLNVDYGKYLGKLIAGFIKVNNITDLDFVASHGHTIFHNPAKGYTLQIGDGATIAATCKQKVVCDFRTQDVARGGQGAPLVPIGDKLLFSEYDYCINIGGFANISFEKDNQRKAFDICPANIILNHYTRQINLEYDDKGQLARTGIINTPLLKALDNLSIYTKNDSMGNEFVVSNIIPLIDSFGLPIPTILHTVIEHVAQKIGGLLIPDTKALITGGGALNDYLIERIKQHTTASIIIPNKTIIDYKEALIFGLLGLLRLENNVNILASVTGADRDHSSGVIYSF